MPSRSGPQSTDQLSFSDALAALTTDDLPPHEGASDDSEGSEELFDLAPTHRRRRSFLARFEKQGPRNAAEESKRRSRLEKFEVVHDAGTLVAITRGKNPKTMLEFMPLAVRLGMKIMWAGREKAKVVTSAHVRRLLEEATRREGIKYDSTVNPLPTIEAFVKTYQLDTKELVIENLADYPSMNAFFSRKLKPNARPQDNPDDPTAITSGADCRLSVFQSVAAARQFWIKGENFTIADLVRDADLAEDLEGGELCIFRLAPADYHRFHSPVDAVVGRTKFIKGAYFTVNPAAVNENLDVFTTNHRAVTILSQRRAGRDVDAAFVAIGAMLVGSINLTPHRGDAVHRGDELGYFAYGGSTCIALFPAGVVQWDSDLLTNSMNKLETLVRVGERIGTFV